MLAEITKEIHEGPFSILSDKAVWRILMLVQWAMQDGYDRGFAAGEKAPRKR